MVVASKSSMYAVPTEPTSFVCPGMRCANSALIWKVDGAVAVIQGILSMALVNHCISVFQLPFTPHMVFASGSEPVFTLVVIGRSRRCMIVPPMTRSLLNSYSRCAPKSDLRCMEKVDWFSSLTSTLVPDSRIEVLRIVTVPMV